MNPMVLIVDDDPVTSDHFARMLRLDGYRVEVANSGQAALHRARQARPDLLILDLQMPLMDGVAVLEQFRSSDNLHDVPAVIITGNYAIEDGVFERLRALGADIHLKPVWVDDLLDVVHAKLSTEVVSGPHGFSTQGHAAVL